MKNLNLDIGFKGNVSVSAQAIPLQEGYLKLGGIVDPEATSALSFGRVVSAESAKPDVFKAGKASGNVVRGISIWDDSIAANAPAHPDSYLQGLPCAVLAHGFAFVNGWTKEATGAIDPVIGAVVIFNTTSGAIEFLESGSSAPSGYEILEGASVKDVDEDNGALVYLG